ncbi:MAG: LytTR family transcriptional regulator [Rudanella sp.]|nr:LytTR family transcriptional regulator [Rudanella sp.]
MLSVLRQPYTVFDPTLVQIRGAGLIGLFIGLFLLVFQPFGLSQWETDLKWLKIVGFGAITFVFTSIHFTFWPALFPRFFTEQRWTVGRAISYILINILLIAVGNFLYIGFLLELPFRSGNVVWMVLVTLAVGVFPATGIVLWGYIRRLRKYQDSAATLQPMARPSPAPNLEHAPQTDAFRPSELSLISLVADNEKDSLTISPAYLLFIESSDNYCTVYYQENGKLQKPLLRSSLSRIENQLANYPRLVRCHRSFIVNLDKVERVTGNAQGYKLHLLDGSLEVPVARRYNETLVASLRAV